MFTILLKVYYFEIKVNNDEGTVEEINMRSTKIRSLDNSIIILPNDVVSGTVIKNVSQSYKRRIFEVFGVTYDTSDDKLKRAIQIIEEIAKNDNRIHDDYIVFVETLAESSINIRVQAYTKTSIYNEYLRIRSDFILEVVKKFREENIEFAFPSQTVYMAKE